MAREHDTKDRFPPALADALFKSNADVEAVAREIRRSLASGDDALAQFLGLLESLRDVVPDDDKCHEAALTALERTSGHKEADVLRAVRGHRDALDRLRNLFEMTVSERGDEMRVLERKAREIQDQVDKLEAQLRTLMQEEQTIRTALSSREASAESAGERFEAALMSVQAEIEELRSRMGDTATAEESVPQDDLSPDFSAEPESEPREKKQCPSCKQDMEWLAGEKSWQCPSCGYQRVEFF